MYMNNPDLFDAAAGSLQDPEVSAVFLPAPSVCGLPCWVALPEAGGAYGPPIVAVHGIKRGAQAQAEKFAAHARKTGRPVIAPLFSEQAWPNYQQVVRKGRADLALFGLMKELRARGIWQTDAFDLAGFSGGAQFAHRFAMLYPETVGRLTVSSAGWFTFPDSSPFPYGVGPRRGRHNWGPVMEDRLAAFLKLPILVTVGERDCKKDRNTRSGPAIDAQQGLHRLERAKSWVEALHVAAALRGLPIPDVTLKILPRCGHGFIECADKGGLADLVFASDPKPSRVPNVA